ncbi:MAG TPA: hypothetical protein VND22_01355 [Actinomycetota bacterium]|nr:hypothetical protein [Actinomycetota bacterium]
MTDRTADDPVLEARQSSGGPRWLKRYPPLVMFILAILIAALVLPSALNLPQANPSTVLEYAPIPPEDDDISSNEGSISELGLGSSTGLSTGAPAPPPGPAGGKGQKPVTKRCVGKPPRQTEDPNSPPCVPFFDGDNGGVTWQGVKADEITVLVYATSHLFIDENPSSDTQGQETTPPAGTYCDVDKPNASEANCASYRGTGATTREPDDHTFVKMVRAYSRYFNERFQTYNRHVHFHIFWSSGTQTPATRRADAQANWERLKPFAVIDATIFGGHNEVYAEAMVKRRAMLFGATAAIPASYYRKFAPYIWSFWPDVEHWVDQYVSYVCTKVAPFPVAHAGAGIEPGERKYAFMWTTDPEYQGLQLFASLAREGLQNCPNGAKLDVVAPKITYSRNQFAEDASPDAATEAATNIATMQDQDVTTVLWLGGYETAHSRQASKVEYFPEWVVAGDQYNDTLEHGQAQEDDVWRHAWVVTNQLREDKLEDSPCRQAFREAEPRPTRNTELEACRGYRSIFTLFKAIQVAGPYLAPETVDQGQHAIPRAASVSSFIAACFYDPGDYTCVKDAHEAWWDSSAPDPTGAPGVFGCYRMVREGKRYLAGEWEGGDDVFQNQSDPCNTVNRDPAISTG